jgi:protein SCO1/2
MPTHARHAGPLLGVITALALAAGCASPGSRSAGFTGDILPTPEILPTVPFTSDTGAATALPQLQQGHLLLVYFGYTHCPDVCPATMAGLAVALRALPAAQARKVQIAFVTSDPVRDTPRVMHAWLSNFPTGKAPAIIGLTSTLPTIDAAAKSIGVPLEPPVKQPDGTYAVTHGAQILAFAHGKADHLWLAGTAPRDFGHDISLLLKQDAI